MTSAAFTVPRLAPAWRVPAMAALALVALLLLSYRETAAAMVDIWSRSETFTHAFVVPPIVAWLIWRRRDALALLQPKPVPWMVLPIAAVAGLWWVGKLAEANVVMHAALTGMLVLTVPLVLGWAVTRALLFPLAFLFFAVPAGEFLTPLLMKLTADVLVNGLLLTGIPVYREGQQLVIPSGRWAVIEECSGIRYLMASFMVGSLFAYLNYRSALRRTIFVAMSIIVPIVANWLRAYIIVMLGHLSGNKIAAGVDHILYGWVFFGIVIMALFFIGARWAEDEAPLPAAAQGSGSVGARAPWLAGVVAAAALLLVQWPLLALRDGGAEAAPVRLALPAALGDWQADDQRPAPWKPEYVKPSLELDRRYSGPDGQVGVHLVYYRGQTREAKLISSANHLVLSIDPKWNILARDTVQADAAGQPLTWQVVRMLAREIPGTERERLTIWRLYWVGGRLTHQDNRARLDNLLQRMRGEPDDSAAVILYSSARDPAQADREIRAFVGGNFERLQRLLADAMAAR